MSDQRPARVMMLPKNPAYPDYHGMHLEDDWCAKAGCVPAQSSLYEDARTMLREIESTEFEHTKILRLMNWKLRKAI